MENVDYVIVTWSVISGKNPYFSEILETTRNTMQKTVCRYLVPVLRNLWQKFTRLKKNWPKLNFHVSKLIIFSSYVYKLTIAVVLHFWLENRWTDSTKLVQIFHRGFPVIFICVLSCWRIFSPSISRWEHIEILGNLNSFFSLITFRSDGTFSSGSLRLSSWSFSANIWRLWIQKCNLKS